MEFENLIQLIQTVSDSALTKLSYEENGIKIELKKEKEQVILTSGTGETGISGPQVGVAGVLLPSVSQPQRTEVQSGIAGQVVKSPLVGTFYEAASPEEEPFVKVGDSVTKGQVLGIVEAMKLMNEIESEYDGVVKEILVANGAVIEFGQPMFIIE